MKIFKIDVSKKKDGFDKLYDILEAHSRYAVYPSTFIALTEDNILVESLKNEKDIKISEVEDVEKDIQKEYIKTWLREEYIKQLHKDAGVEVQERTQAMYDILKQVENHFKEEDAAADEKDTKRKERSNTNEGSAESSK